MCHYITATLAPSADIEAVGRIAAGFQRAWRRIDSGPVAARLRAGETYYLTTPGYCDCGTVLGMARSSISPEVAHAKKIKQLRRDGWSESKIERWHADKRKADEKHQDSWTRSAGTSAEGWLELLHSVVSSEAATRVGLLLHLYSGLIEDADIQFDREPVSLAKITPAFLLNIEEDVLYEFSR